MQTKSLARYVFHPLLAAATLLTAGSVFAQAGGPAGGGPAGGGSNQITICHIPPGNPNNPQTLTIAGSALSAHLAHGDYQGACRPPGPDASCKPPITMTLNASTPYALQNDFSSGSWANHVQTLGYTGINKQYLHTFKWDRNCGKIVKADLIVNMKANSGGASATSSDAGNDRIGVYHGGTGILGEAVYSAWPFPAGTAVTKQFNMITFAGGAALAVMNQFNSLSFVVQDDTSVTSATLQLTIQ